MGRGRPFNPAFEDDDADVLRAAPERNRARSLWLCAGGLESGDPGLQRRLSKPPVATEAHVRNAARTRLGPDPVGPHAQAFGDFLGGQQPIHRAQFPDVLITF